MNVNPVAVVVAAVASETARPERTSFSAQEIPQSVSAEKCRQPKMNHLKRV